VKTYHPLFAIITICTTILAVPSTADAVVDNEDSLFIAAGETHTLGGTHTYGMLVKIELGGMLYVTTYSGGAGTGELTLQAPEIVIAGFIDGNGRGFRGAGDYQEGPGVGGYPGGGAGYGGGGGLSGYGSPPGSGGPAYGTTSERDIEKGSGGGDAGAGYGGGNGGAAISLISPTLTITGLVTSNGTNGTAATWGAGGGSGGGIYLESMSLTMAGILSATGGNGNAPNIWHGAGGAGGRIKVFVCSMDWSGNYTVNGGAVGGVDAQAGGTGTLTSLTYRQPTITSIADVGNDQGRHVRISWNRACFDDNGESNPITHYTIWRRIDDQAKSPSEMTKLQGRMAYPPGAWDYINTVPARGEGQYNTVVPTLADSNATGMHWSTFFVSAVTADPFIYYDSDPDSGYSVDNLAPTEPSPFTAHAIDAETVLDWGENTEADFHAYTLHRGASEGFIPGPGNLLATQGSTGHVDHGSTGEYYKLAAVDFSGNISPYALVTPGETVGVSGSSGLSFSLSATSPARNRIPIRFSLPGGGPALLELFDIRGRAAAARRDVSALGPGRHALNLGEGNNLSSGVYFIRLTQGLKTKTVRSVVIR